MVTSARIGCHLNGIMEILLKLRKPIVAVKITRSNVVAPP
jgi:hypothetical protein